MKEKATLNKEDFIISKEIKLDKKFNPFKLSSWLNLHWKYWSIIGASIQLATAVVAVFICWATRPTSAIAPTPIQVSNTNNVKILLTIA